MTFYGTHLPVSAMSRSVTKGLTGKEMGHYGSVPHLLHHHKELSERRVRKGVLRLQKRVTVAWSASAPRIDLQLIICSCTHLRFIKPDQLTREPVGWDKLAASEIKDGIARYVK
jgi:hypothetical protein